MARVNRYLEKEMQGQGKLMISICLLFILFLSSVRASSQSFSIAKIDSTSNHYLIYISAGDSLKGIIVSKKKVAKGNGNTIKKIKTGQEYKLKLEKYRLLRFINRTSFDTETGGVAIDGVAIWKPSCNYELYETRDLQGLFYRKR
jgi:hypothetical protein